MDVNSFQFYVWFQTELQYVDVPDLFLKWFQTNPWTVSKLLFLLSLSQCSLCAGLHIHTELFNLNSLLEHLVKWGSDYPIDYDNRIYEWRKSWKTLLFQVASWGQWRRRWASGVLRRRGRGQGAQADPIWETNAWHGPEWKSGERINPGKENWLLSSQRRNRKWQFLTSEDWNSFPSQR